MPNKFEISQETNQPEYSNDFRQICALLHDDVKLFVIMTTSEDLERARNNDSESKHRRYEMQRLNYLKKRLNFIKNSESVQLVSEAEEQLYVANIMPCIQDVLTCTEQILLMSGNKVGNSYSNLYDDLSNRCNKLSEMLQNLRLAVVKPRWYDNSDAGPGVGITNFEVKFRDAELTMLYERDYACRLHSARGSSGDNEAERTNSAVGDSIVDGATLQWNKFQKFHNLTDDEIANLTIQDYDSHEETRMEMNAWWVAKELSYRIDGAPVFSEYIHCSDRKT